MYDDAPQELVHDLIADAVFGDHPLGRPVIGTAEVISSIPRDAIARYHDTMYVPGNIVVAAAGNVEHDQVVELVSRALERRVGGRWRHDEPPAAARPGAAAAAALPAEGHRAVPRLPRRAGHLAFRPPPVRRVAARCDPRRLRVVAALPGDPREARDGVRRLLVRLPVHRHRSDRHLPRHARGQPRRGARDHGRADRRHRRAATSRTASSSRAKENIKGRILLSMESTSTRMNRLGKSLITDSELLSRRPDRRRDRRGRRGVGLRAGCGAARTRAALRGVHRPEPGALPRRARACDADARARGVKILLNGRRGKVGSVLAPALEAAGHRLVDSLAAADAMVDFTRPDAALAERAGGGRGRRPVRRRHDRLGSRGGRAAPALPSSTRRTSRSAPC